MEHAVPVPRAPRGADLPYAATRQLDFFAQQLNSSAPVAAQEPTQTCMRSVQHTALGRCCIDDRELTQNEDTATIRLCRLSQARKGSAGFRG
jgi:hypothetical protein